jgi:hypothetical protein
MNTVIHIIYGRGQVVSKKDGYIAAVFDGVTRTFLYPSAFGRYLKYEDSELQKAALCDLEEQKRKETEKNAEEYREIKKAALARSLKRSAAAAKRVKK